MKPKHPRKTKSANRRSVQPIVRQMWAVCWFDYGGQSNPNPYGKHGPWMLCHSKPLAEAKRVNSNQIITRVRVAILPNEKVSDEAGQKG
jgi:hypothetical protein